MAANETLHARVQEAFRLSPLLWEAQSAALAESQVRCQGLSHFAYPSTRPMMIRPCFREALIKIGLPDGWALGGDTTKMVQIYLVNKAARVRLRYLKERRATYPGGVPTAGRNPVRQAYWTPTLFDTDNSLAELCPTNLLLLWDYLDSSQPETGFTLRVVHTVAPGNWGQRTPIDLSVDLPQSLDLETSLVFKDSAEDTDFFADLSEEAADGTTIA